MECDTLAGATLSEVQQEFDGANYPPDPSCSNCGGTGYDGPRRMITGDGIKIVDDEHMPCSCLYVGNQDAREALNNYTP